MGHLWQGSLAFALLVLVGCGGAHSQRPAGAETGRNGIGVALDDDHLLRRQVEVLRDKLRIRGLMALPG